MPFAEKYIDHHQIRFYHRGEFELQTELGVLEVKAGDFVVIPLGLIYREVPKTNDNVVMIFETAAPIKPAEEEERKLNFDTKARLSWTPEARKAFLPDPNLAVYTSLYGAHIGIVPEQATRYVKK